MNAPNESEQAMTAPIFPRHGRTLLRRPVAILCAGLMLAGCQRYTIEGAYAPAIIHGYEISDGGTKNLRAEACYGKDETPAVIETVMEQVMVAPAEFDAAGNLRKPAVFEMRETQAVVDGREALYFETPCPEQLTAPFIASVQRALIARGYLSGQPSGVFDRGTGRAIRRFQAPLGLNSDVLSIEAAQQLGLVAY